MALNAVAYGNGLWVAVGDVVGGTDPYILTSPDGANWTSRISGATYGLDGVAWSDTLSLFVAVGDNGTILTSPDGVTWTSRTSGATYGLDGIT